MTNKYCKHAIYQIWSTTDNQPKLCPYNKLPYAWKAFNDNRISQSFRVDRLLIHNGHVRFIFLIWCLASVVVLVLFSWPLSYSSNIQHFFFISRSSISASCCFVCMSKHRAWAADMFGFVVQDGVRAASTTADGKCCWFCVFVIDASESLPLSALSIN